tara:strand:+ start:29 stop:247 length:219 start_codon:yes stop_codon:yes gene_type:complete
MIGIGKKLLKVVNLLINMRYAFLRGIQLFAMIIIISGFVMGIRLRNMDIELSSLVIGAVIFYMANLLIEKSN